MMDKVSDDYIINYLKNNYYCELRCSDIEGVGTFALRDIPYGIDPYIPFKKYILNRRKEEEYAWLDQQKKDPL